MKPAEEDMNTRAETERKCEAPRKKNCGSISGTFQN